MSMNRHTTRAARLVYVRDLLLEAPRTISQLAALCGVQERTIYRDLVDLQVPPLNVPLACGNDGYWRVLMFD